MKDHASKHKNTFVGKPTTVAVPMTISISQILEEGPALRKERGSRGGRGKPCQAWHSKNWPRKTGGLMTIALGFRVWGLGLRVS